MKQSFFCDLIKNTPITNEIFRLDFAWPGTAPKAGQFFMIKPKRGSLFLGRPISAALWEPAARTVQFLIVRRGKGTGELAELYPGEKAELLGPLGNAWAGFLPANFRADCDAQTDAKKTIALIGGGVGIAPLHALAAELPRCSFDFYAGFRTISADEQECLLDTVKPLIRKCIIAIEDYSNNFPCAAVPLYEKEKELNSGRIPDFLNPADYAAVYACGPEAMLKTVAEKCASSKVPCYVSMERRMACGTGACLGCAVVTSQGNRRCCADGPIFPAQEVFF